MKTDTKDVVLDKELKTEFLKLLRLFQKGVTKLGIMKFNRIMSQVITKYSSNSEDVDMVMKLVCQHFNITEETLYNSRSKGEVYSAKIIAFKILNSTLGISASDIGKKFNRYQNSVAYAIKKFNQLQPEKKAAHKKIFQDYNAIMVEVKRYTNSKIIENN